MADGGKIIVLSEYSIAPVNRSIAPNRLLRQAGLLQTRSTPDGVLVDFEKSAAIALVDHQIAHVYLKASTDRNKVASILRSDDTVQVLPPSAAIAHPRAGQIQLQGKPGIWFDYRWWEAPSEAPAFATTVDIHRKSGYDPLELFLEPGTRSITQNAALVRGSHGANPGSEGLVIGAGGNAMEMTGVPDVVRSLLNVNSG